MNKVIIDLDNLDDRRTVHDALAMLSPRQRMAFLVWCCNQCKLGRPGVFGTGQNVGECFADFWGMYMYGLDIRAGVAELISRVRVQQPRRWRGSRFNRPWPSAAVKGGIDLSCIN